ncbi:MAG: nicotinamide-nucleotide adenylyltransferase [Candidatus Micrarchaeota archaeon]|nr:nicotinamide-nucleotide adenylyltransferase [Candidatus Micrarchaeota archaeon]
MGKKFVCGLFMGRFQPFHKGHMSALKFASARCKEIVIGIGSSQHFNTERNPLSSSDRIKIIRAALSGSKTRSAIRVIDVPDFNDNDKWFGYIKSKEPKIDVVFSRNSLVKSIFRDHGITVISPPWHDRRRLAATKIRGLIRKGRRWQDRVPKGAVAEINLRKEKIIRSG